MVFFFALFFIRSDSFSIFAVRFNIDASCFSDLFKLQSVCYIVSFFNIDSTDGLFQGTFAVMVRDNVALNQLVKKLKGVKGVKNVERS